MLSFLFHSIVAFAKYTAICLYMLSVFLFVVYGMAFGQAYLEGLIK